MERSKNNRAVYRDKWWHYAEKRPALYSTIADMKRVLTCSEVTKHLSFCFAPTGLVYSAKLDVFLPSYALFAVLQSSEHEAWARHYSSQLETRLKYSPGNAFETFPFPLNMQKIDDIGENYYQHRQSIMLARQEGLTKTYNHFHDPQDTAVDIVRLRELHREMDEAVAKAYGWSDLRLEHGFHKTKQGLRYTISEAARGTGQVAVAEPPEARGRSRYGVV